ncbi:hypothetical protein DFP72DRAFT_987681 [Ephemerocybe angulata]|uniref:Transcription factor domain-containing protein n=1 Tax=Ephemerocybe angulata TaxID=980116 RepID=A0A8H6I9K7_9AGAR|nr:hypothetical protein DFP72DRAFT_987681 [Tulosesus angulatus]
MNVDAQPGSGDAPASRKIGLSCAECRRVLMAHAQRLQEQVKGLTARCQQLERELARTTGTDVDDLGTMQELQEPVSIVSQGMGSLSIGLDGQAKYHGETSSSENEDFSTTASRLVNLPPDILDLMNAFPFGFRESPYKREMFAAYIPDFHLAEELAELYFANIGWMYEPITRQDFRNSVLEVLYGSKGEKSVEAAHPHRISLFFIILASGCLFHGDPETVATAKVYEALSRASFSLDSILVEATMATVQTLFLIVRFIYNEDRDRNEERWILVGLSCRVAHMFFWELFVWDAWTSVVNGRPAALAAQHTDCQFPEDLEPHIGPNKEMEIGYSHCPIGLTTYKRLIGHAWKIRYSANILTASYYHVFSPRTPPYKSLLDLDKKIRAFPIPNHLRSPVRITDTTRSWNSSAPRAMQQYCTICLRESNLLYIHRSYFAQALKQQPDNPLQHAYAASVLAAYRSATRLITSLQSLYAVHPRLTSTVWYFWSGVFSSCIVLGALVVESPKCTLALDALRELQAAIPFYESGSRGCRSQSTVPILEKLLKRAVAAYQAGSGLQQDISADVDELQLLGGRKTVIKTSSSAGSPHTTSPATPSSGVMGGSDGGNSPNSNPGAMEMLQKYCGSIGQQAPGYSKAETYNSSLYGHGVGMHMSGLSYAPEETTRTSSKSPVGQMGSLSGYHTPQGAPYLSNRPFLSPPGSSLIPEPGLSYKASQIQMEGITESSSTPISRHHSSSQTQQQYHEPWSMYSSPSMSHQGHGRPEEYSQPTPPQQPQQRGYSAPMYGHPLKVNHPDAFPQIIHRYPSGEGPLEPTQEEIWRDFMMGYQQPN